MSERKIIKAFDLDGDPVKDLEGNEVRRVEFRKLKGKELRMSAKPENAADADVYLLSQMSGLPAQAFDEMDGPDLAELLTWLDDYLGKKKPQTGETASETSPIDSTSSPAS